MLLVLAQLHFNAYLNLSICHMGF